MESFPVNVTDMVVVAVIIISAALAFARGFVHEALAISGWIIAYFGAKALGPMVDPLVAAILDAFPSVRKFVEDYFDVGMVVSLGGLILSFALILIVCSVIAHLIAGRIRKSALNAVDRSLGFAFGIARGALLVSLAYLLATWIWTADEQPPWLKEAKSRRLLNSGAEFLKDLAPEGLDLAAQQKEKKKSENPPVEGMPEEQVPPVDSQGNP